MTRGQIFDMIRPRMNLPTVLLTIFVVLKLTGNIDWSWWWVMAPLLIFAPLLMVLLVVVVVDRLWK